MDEKSTQEGHRRRLRQRFRESGLAGFQDHEVLELLLTLSTPRKDCKGMAWELLNQFKTLPAVFEAGFADLCAVKGIGETNAIPIKLVKAAADRFLKQRIKGREVLGTPQAVLDYLYLELRESSREVFMVMFLDVKNRLLETEKLFQGSLSASPVYPREVLRSVLAHQAASVILVHNHPSGDTEPSREDYAITRRLVHTLAPVNVTVHEHLIIGSNRHYSFAEQGVIRAMYEEVRQAESRFMQEWAPG
ncbi:DNA repair protein RadC [Desulfobotulus alkaliphilus]|uniref:DNA repair protein RadC n=1 Tax=Desulfobotulus alkaliphilus TaxID=622671 RepID=A0A562RR91_9BACT|nr:DNA repair protein RadC [Desulfobotulus alkaliphilus]TWI71597.1 DNA repair protein RadC [Desulfobotulus alkaliphilus]